MTHDVLSVIGHSEQGRSGRRGDCWGIEARRQAMGIDWTSQNGLSQAIPPLYTEHIGKQMMEQIS
jgi:hypothetical protein